MQILLHIHKHIRLDEKYNFEKKLFWLESNYTHKYTRQIHQDGKRSFSNLELGEDFDKRKRKLTQERLELILNGIFEENPEFHYYQVYNNTLNTLNTYTFIGV